MVMNLLDLDPMSSSPLVRLIVPPGRTITTSLLLVVVSRFAASTPSRRLGPGVTERGDVSPVPVTTIVVVAACAGMGAIEMATPRRRTPAAVSAAGRTRLRVFVEVLAPGRRPTSGSATSHSLVAGWDR